MGRWIALSLVVLCATLGNTRAQAQARVAIYPQLSHTEGVNSVAFSPDGQTLASGSRDDTIKLWDVASGREFATLRGHTYAVTSVAFSPDGRTLASGSKDHTVKLWDMAGGLRTLGVHSGVASVAFSPDSRTLASGSDDHTIKLWDVASGREIRTLSGHSGAATSVAFSPDGRTFASGSDDHTIKLWDVASGREIRTLSGHSGAVTSVAFSHDGRALASGSADDTVKLWDVASGREVKTLSGLGGQSVAFSRDGRTVASGNGETIELWDVASGREIRTLSGHSLEVTSVAFSPDSRTLASGSADKTIKLWDVATGREIRTRGRSNAVNSVAFSPDGRMLASGDRSWNVDTEPSNTIKLWDVVTGRLLTTLSGHLTWVSSVAFSPDSRMLASGSMDYTIMLSEVASGRKVRTLSGHSSAVYSVAFSPDGRTLASGSKDDTIKLWDAASGRELRTLSGHSDTVWSVAFSPDGRTLASGSDDHTIKLWEVASGRALRTLNGHSGAVDSVAFSPDGRTLASGSDDQTIKLWDMASGRELRTLRGHSSLVGSVAFSPDGRTLASASGDNTIKLWDVASGRELRTLSGHSNDVNSVAFSPDGRTLASAGLDGTTRIWDVTSGAQRAALVALDDGVSLADGASLAVTPEGFFNSSSEQAEDNLNVRIGNRVFGISSFRDKFYRPDLVRRALAGEDISQYGSIDNVKLSPVVEFAGLPTTATDPQVKLTLNLANGGGGFGPIRLYANNTMVRQDDDVPSSGNTVTRSYSVPLLSGTNELRVAAFNADASMTSEVRATVTGPAAARSASAHGTLHALVIGIQVFPSALDNNLKYPVADATMIASTLAQKAAPLFDKLDIELLTAPAQTDKADLVRALRTMQTSARPDDEFVFFVASHGIVVGNQYYVLASDMANPPNTTNLLAHALSAGELSDLLGNIGARKKLVILDTCYAGAAGDVLATGGTQRSATVLARDMGVTVLAATNSSQEALEGGTQDHGLFSYVLNDGLSGKGTAAVDQASGIVTNFLLADYVKKQVSAMAQTILHRNQKPTTETSGQSFPVTKVR